MNLEEEDALIYSEIEEEGETEEALAASLASLGIDEDAELSTHEEEEEVSAQPGIQSSCKGIDTHSDEKDTHHHQSDGLAQNMLLIVPLNAKRTCRKAHHQNIMRKKLWTIRDEANWACEQLQEKQYLLMAQLPQPQIVNYLRFKRTRKLVNESQRVEALGGMMTADGTRKRSLGGIFFTLLKSEIPADKIRKMRANAGSRSQQKNTHARRKRRRHEQDWTPVVDASLQHALKVARKAALKVRALEKH